MGVLFSYHQSSHSEPWFPLLGTLPCSNAPMQLKNPGEWFPEIGKSGAKTLWGTKIFGHILNFVFVSAWKKHTALYVALNKCWCVCNSITIASGHWHVWVSFGYLRLCFDRRVELSELWTSGSTHQNVCDRLNTPTERCGVALSTSSYLGSILFESRPADLLLSLGFFVFLSLSMKMPENRIK